LPEPVRWDRWRPFPTLVNGGFGTVPIGSGVIWLRNRTSSEEVYIGASDHVAQHLPDLLLKPPVRRSTLHGPLQEYVTTHVAVIDYRTAPCATKKQADELAAALRADNPSLF